MSILDILVAAIIFQFLFLFLLSCVYTFLVLKHTNWSILKKTEGVIPYVMSGLWSKQKLRKFIKEEKISNILSLRFTLIAVLIIALLLVVIDQVYLWSGLFVYD
ncbi:hypothetical protein SSPSH_001663 [Salinisphaera shabanensis E1L3A]|uniref:Uncharacterized protein n=1 Tax=Salinisphaera shabanensis E1L3A TaxID=1033802 RepID=U2FTH6_9GAMM|nr:hypothetical protein SSPSH_001663 [Salinisphaera shabanensis E1L3A]